MPRRPAQAGAASTAAGKSRGAAGGARSTGSNRGHSASVGSANMMLPFILDPTKSQPPPPGTAPAKIHAREARLDRVLEFVTFVAKPMPLSLLLDEAPKKIASIVKADV